MTTMTAGAMALALLSVVAGYAHAVRRHPVGDLFHWLLGNWGTALLLALLGAAIGASMAYALAPESFRSEVLSKLRARMVRVIGVCAAVRQSITAARRVRLR
jgi:hypothetical protein